jgi:hypothetical protein
MENVNGWKCRVAILGIWTFTFLTFCMGSIFIFNVEFLGKASEKIFTDKKSG